MRNVIAIVLSSLLLVTAGCRNSNDDSAMQGGMSSEKGMMDACPHCAGVQQMTTDGKCPECGMKMTAMNKSSSSSDTQYMAADVCTHCAGKQAATSVGTCPSCGMKVSGAASSDPKQLSTDVCTHCAGNQTATAGGKCPMCGMKVK